MDVFLSYASEERPLAERVCRVLEAEGHDVFFDREDLGGGDAFGERIRNAMADADVLVYLISHASVASKSYALTELSIATSLPKRRRPAVLPVRTDDTPIEAVPAALRAHTILEPQGDTPAEIALAIDRIRAQRRRHQITMAAVAGLVLAIAAGGYAGIRWFNRPTSGAATAEANTTPTLPSSAGGDPIEAFNAAMLNRTAPDKRVTLTAMPGDKGWTGILNVVDMGATRVSYRIDNEAFTDTGSTGLINNVTGQPRPNTTIRIPGDFWRKRTVVVKYTDAKGVEQGPYNLEFDPRAEFLRFTKQALATVAWVTISDVSDAGKVAYFTTLISFKAALREIRYSFDSDAFDRVWPLKVNPSEGWPPTFTDETLYVPVPPAARFIMVRVTYADGSMDTQRVDR